MNSIRKQLYSKFFIPISYDFDIDDEVVDLSADVTNQTRISAFDPAKTVPALKQSKIIFTDSIDLAGVIGKLVQNVPIIPAPYGYCTAQDMNTNFVIGILNHDSCSHMNNLGYQELFQATDGYEVLIFGEPFALLPEAEVTDDLNYFAGKCDILLLPGMPQYPSPIAVPLSVMMAETAVITLPESLGYRNLTQAAGVVTIPESVSL